MTNIPQNSSYTNNNGINLSKYKNLVDLSKYTNVNFNAPKKNYFNNDVFTPSPTYKLNDLEQALPLPSLNGLTEDTPEYNAAKKLYTYRYLQQKSLKREHPEMFASSPVAKQGVITVDTKANIPIESDYGVFQEPQSYDYGENKLSWGIPDKPVIKNLQVLDSTGKTVTGQYVEDLSDKNKLVKTVRGKYDPVYDSSFRGATPGFMGTIDHTIPLLLGGADNAANRELLNPADNYRKTKSNAVAYTLYAYGDISLNKARMMALQWRNPDVSDVPIPNKFGLVSNVKGGKTGIEISREVLKHWNDAQPVGLKQVMAEVPNTAAHLGDYRPLVEKGYLPKSILKVTDPMAEFVKGFESEATAGFVPYVARDDSLSTKIASTLGRAGGFLSLFGMTEAVAKTALKSGRSGLAGLKALKGIKGAKEAETALDLEKSAVAINDSKTIARETLDTLNGGKNMGKVASFARYIKTPGQAENLMKISALTAVIGQEKAFINNKFNPYILSGQKEATKQQHIVKKVLGDLMYGAATGVIPLSSKGVLAAAMVPTTLSMINNPDDPTQAIIDGIVYGTMHARATIKNSAKLKEMGYTNGKKPVIDPYSDAWNKAAEISAYETLRSYDKTLPELKKGERVPDKYKTQENIQKTLDTAINKVYELLFFGKNNSTIKSAEDLKTKYQELNSKLDSLNNKKLRGKAKFSLKARKEASRINKANEEYVTKEYGKGFSEVKTGDKDMTLQTAMAEIKRLIVSARELYKGSLPDAMRKKADLDDLMSFNKEYITKRFLAQEAFINPPRNQDIVDAFNDDLLTKSFNNELPNRQSTDLNTTMGITGYAKNDVNAAKATDFMNRVKKGTASKIIIVGKRPDIEPVLNIKNRMISEEAIKNGTDAIDKNPDKALQAYGIVFDKTPEGNIINKRLVELGWGTTEHRRQTGKYAFNNNSLVKEGKIPALESNNVQMFDNMSKHGLDYIIMNIDPMSTAVTKEGYPFIVGNMRDSNWSKSIELKKVLEGVKDTNPVSIDIAKYKNTNDPAEKAKLIETAKEKGLTAGDLVTKSTATRNSPESKKVVVTLQENTRDSISMMKETLNVDSPRQVKEMFKKNFSILLEDNVAQDIFNRRESIELRNFITELSKAGDSTKPDVVTQIRLSLMKEYLRSGMVSDMIYAMPVLGKPKFTGIEDTAIIPSKTKNFSIKSESDYIEPINPQEQNNVKDSTINNIANNIVKTASSENIPKDATNEKNGEVTTRKATPEEIRPAKDSDKIQASINDMISRAKTILENINPNGGGRYTPVDAATGKYKAGRGAEKTVSDLIHKIQRLEPAGVSDRQADIIKKKRLDLSFIDSIAPRISEVFDMPIEDAQTLVNEIVEKNNKNKQKFINQKRNKSKGSFIEKNPLTNVSQYDILKNKRLKAGNDVIKWAKTGIKNSQPDSYSYAFSKVLNDWLVQTFGAHYANDTSVKELLGRAFGNEGSAKKLFKGYFSTSNAKKELTPYSQSKEFLNILATGDVKAREKAISKVIGKPINKDTTFTDNDLKTIKSLGFDVKNKKLSGTGIKTGEQIDKIEGLSKADFQLLPGISSIEMAGAKETGPSAIRRGIEDARNIIQFIIKAHNTTVDNAKEYNGKKSKINQRKISFDLGKREGTLREKTNSLFNDIYKRYMNRLNIRNDKQAEIKNIAKDIPKLKKQIKHIKEAIDNPEERSNWETPEMLKENLASAQEKLSSGLKKIREIKQGKKDGEGGPGYGYDGRGGFWSSLGNSILHPIDTITHGWNNLNKPYVKQIQIAKPEETKQLDYTPFSPSQQRVTSSLVQGLPDNSFSNRSIHKIETDSIQNKYKNLATNVPNINDKKPEQQKLPEAIFDVGSINQPIEKKQALLESISSAENNGDDKNSYEKFAGGIAGQRDKTIPISSVADLKNRYGQKALGKYQIQMPTAIEVLESNGIDPNTFVFNKEGQDRIANFILNRRLNSITANKKEITPSEVIYGLSKEWAALPKDSSNQSYYSNNKALIPYEYLYKVIKEFLQNSIA